jgi:hypothetical protein
MIQTTCMLLALVLSVWLIMQELHFHLHRMMAEIRDKHLTRIFFGDWKDKKFLESSFSAVLSSPLP